MRKILLMIVVCLLLVCSGFFIVNGIDMIGIKGFLDLNEENNKLNQKIEKLSNETMGIFESSQSKIKNVANDLINSKTEYENQAILSSSQTSNYVTQTEKYDIGYLWTRLGNYAKDEGCTLRIDVTSTSEGKQRNLYNLKFNVGGSYAGITDFIYDIENDSKLGFQIENFLIASPGETLTATFDCKDIPISEFQEGQKMNTTNDGTTNTTANNTQTNTTDSGNTTSNTSASSEGNS